MRILGTILAILYAGLMLFAVCAEPSKSISSAIIIIGCVLIVAYALLGIVRRKNLIYLLIVGMICISAGTLINGFRQDNLHASHHIIRLVAETVIVAICWIRKPLVGKKGG